MRVVVWLGLISWHVAKAHRLARQGQPLQVLNHQAHQAMAISAGRGQPNGAFTLAADIALPKGVVFPS